MPVESTAISSAFIGEMVAIEREQIGLCHPHSRSRTNSYATHFNLNAYSRSKLKEILNEREG